MKIEADENIILISAKGVELYLSAGPIDALLVEKSGVANQLLTLLKYGELNALPLTSSDPDAALFWIKPELDRLGIDLGTYPQDCPEDAFCAPPGPNSLEVSTAGSVHVWRAGTMELLRRNGTIEAFEPMRSILWFGWLHEDRSGAFLAETTPQRTKLSAHEREEVARALAGALSHE